MKCHPDATDALVSLNLQVPGFYLDLGTDGRRGGRSLVERLLAACKQPLILEFSAFGLRFRGRVLSGRDLPVNSVVHAREAR